MLLALLLIGGAIAFWSAAYAVHDESLRITSLLGALLMLIAGLMILPWPFKLLIAVILLIMPSCEWHRLNHSVACPRLCLQRKQCLKSHP